MSAALSCTMTPILAFMFARGVMLMIIDVDKIGALFLILMFLLGTLTGVLFSACSVDATELSQEIGVISAQIFYNSLGEFWGNPYSSRVERTTWQVKS